MLREGPLPTSLHFLTYPFRVIKCRRDHGPCDLEEWCNCDCPRVQLSAMMMQPHFSSNFSCGTGSGLREWLLYSAPFQGQCLLEELYTHAPLQATTLHTVSYRPGDYGVRRSIVYMAGGCTLISSRIYERTDAHPKNILKGCIYEKFPDVVNFNFDLVNVHWSISAIDPVVDHARFHYVVVVFEEEHTESSLVLKLDLPPYEEIGAIYVPVVLTKSRLVTQTGIDLVCGPEGELCVCYRNGHEFPHGIEIYTCDGDFFVCWLDDDPSHAAGVELTLLLCRSQSCTTLVSLTVVQCLMILETAVSDVTY